MALALALGRRGLGLTWPVCLAVGAVIVKDGVIVEDCVDAARRPAPRRGRGAEGAELDGQVGRSVFGNIAPDETVKLVFNLSRDEDVRGPWNEEPHFDYVADPQPQGGLPRPPINADDEGHASRVSSKPKKRS